MSASGVVMGIQVPPINLDAVGIPGRVEKIEWGTWESQDGKYKKEGILIHLARWNYPVRWSVKKKGRGWDPNCGASRALAHMSDIGLCPKDAVTRGNFNLDSMVGRVYLWADIHPWTDLPDAGINVPVALADLDGDASTTSTSAASPEARVLEIIGRHADGITAQGLTDVFIRNDNQDLVEAWFSGLKEKLASNPSVSVGADGKFRLRAPTPSQ